MLTLSVRIIVKTISFETAPLKYTLPMTLQTPKDPSFPQGMDGIRLQNVRLAPTHKVHSYIKYLLRSSVGLAYLSLLEISILMLFWFEFVGNPISYHVQGHKLHIIAMCHDSSE